MKVRSLVSFPVFQDEEQTRVARLLHAVLALFAVILVALLPVVILALPENTGRWLTIVATVCFTHAVLMVANHRGATRAASVALLVELWLIITITTATSGGILSPSTAGYLVLVLVAGLLFDERRAVYVGMFSALTTLGLVALEYFHQLPPSSVTHTALSRWISLDIYIALVIAVQLLATGSIRKSLLQARRELQERRRSETALRQSEERYRCLVTATAQVVWSTNAVGDAIDDQPSWRGFTGQGGQEIQGRGWLHAIHPEDRERTNAIWNHAVATRTVYETEYRLRRSDGRWRQMMVRGVPILEKDGTIREWVGFCHDITSRRQAEAEVGKLNDMFQHIASVTANTLGKEYFRTLVEHLAQSLGARYAFVCQVTGDRLKGHTGHTLAVWAGDGLVKNFEYALEKTPCANVVGQTMCVYPNNVQKLFPEDLVLTQMGVESYCGTPIFGPAGNALGLLVVLDDKPMEMPDQRLRALLHIFASRAGMELERLRIDEALRKSEEKFAKAFQCSPVIFTVSTAEGMRYIAVNETFTEATGYNTSEAIGHTATELGLLAAPEDLPRFVHQLFADGYIRNYEVDMRTKSGELRTGLISAEVIEIGGQQCVLTITEDITERKKAQLILQQSHDELERLVRTRTEELQTKNKELEAFAYTASHDLQSPLHAILGLSRAIDEDYRGRLDPEGADFLRRIILASERMMTLISDLLEFSRVGRKAIVLQAVPLNDFVREIVGDFALRLREINGTIDVTDLPAVLGDKSLLTQIFCNLFQNAINYRDKQRPLKVSVTSRNDGNNVVIRVTDNGIGIAPQYHKQIFAAFQRLQSDEKCRGTGLGLANVKKSTEALGGDVWVESEVGKGSTFCVKLQRSFDRIPSQRLVKDEPIPQTAH